MKNLFAVVFGIVPLFVNGAAFAQSGPMMSGSMGGGGPETDQFIAMRLLDCERDYQSF